MTTLHICLLIFASMACGAGAAAFALSCSPCQTRKPVPPPAPPAPLWNYPITPGSVPNGWATVLSDEQFCRIWSRVPIDHEVYQAVQQLLNREIIQALDDFTDPKHADKPGALAGAQGELRALLTLTANLERARTTPEIWTTARK